MGLTRRVFAKRRRELGRADSVFDSSSSHTFLLKLELELEMGFDKVDPDEFELELLLLKTIPGPIAALILA